MKYNEVMGHSSKIHEAWVVYIEFKKLSAISFVITMEAIFAKSRKPLLTIRTTHTMLWVEWRHKNTKITIYSVASIIPIISYLKNK